MPLSQIVFVIIVVAVASLCVYFIHRCWPYTKRQKHNDVAGFVFGAIAVLYAVLLAFVVISGWESLQSARQATYTEADQLANVYWISRSIPAPQGLAVESLSLKYAHTVIDVEWPLMAKGESSQQAQLDMDQMRNDVLAFTPRTARQQTLYEQALVNVNGLSAARRDRLVDVDETIEGPLWVVLIIGGVLTVCFSMLFGLENKGVHIAMVAALAVMTTISLLLINDIQYPFAGNPHIGPQAFQVFLSQTNH